MIAWNAFPVLILVFEFDIGAVLEKQLKYLEEAVLRCDMNSALSVDEHIEISR